MSNALTDGMVSSQDEQRRQVGYQVGSQVLLQEAHSTLQAGHDALSADHNSLLAHLEAAAVLTVGFSMFQHNRVLHVSGAHVCHTYPHLLCQYKAAALNLCGHALMHLILMPILVPEGGDAAATSVFAITFCAQCTNCGGVLTAG